MHRGWIAFVLVLSLGCSYVPTTRMEYEPLEIGASPAPFALAVEPLLEERPPRVYTSYSGRALLTYAPLIPWIKIPYERLDESYMKAHGTPEPWGSGDEHFTRKVSLAIAEDLRRSGVFREVRFVDRGKSWEGADLVLGGKLRSTEFDAYATSYLLGAPGVVLWILALPVGRNAATVDLELELRDRTGTVVWSQRATGRAGRLVWLYTPNAKVSGEFGLEIYRYGLNAEGVDPNSLWAYHAAALRRAMSTAKESLRAALESARR